MKTIKNIDDFLEVALNINNNEQFVFDSTLDLKTIYEYLDAHKDANNDYLYLCGLCLNLGIGVIKDSSKAYKIFSELKKIGYKYAYVAILNQDKNERNSFVDKITNELNNIEENINKINSFTKMKEWIYELEFNNIFNTTKEELIDLLTSSYNLIKDIIFDYFKIDKKIGAILDEYEKAELIMDKIPINKPYDILIPNNQIIKEDEEQKYLLLCKENTFLFIETNKNSRISIYNSTKIINLNITIICKIIETIYLTKNNIKLNDKDKLGKNNIDEINNKKEKLIDLVLKLKERLPKIIESQNRFYGAVNVSLGKAYEKGNEIKKDLSKALECYNNALNVGHIYAYDALISFYSNSIKDLFLSNYFKYKKEGYNDADAYFTSAYQEYLAFTNYNNKEKLKKLKEDLNIALEHGAQIALNILDRIQNEEIKASFIAMAPKNTFISFNNKNADLKNKIVSNIENKYKCYNSDRDRIGDMQISIKDSLSRCKNFVILLTGNSFSSKWIYDEAYWALEKKLNIALFIFKIKKNLLGQYKEYDTCQELEKLPSDHPIKKIYKERNCSFIEYDDFINYYKNNNGNVIINNIMTCLDSFNNRILYDIYKKKNNNFKTFNFLVSSSINNENNNIITALNLNTDYINRKLVDNDGKIFDDNNYQNNKIYLIKGDGGCGKSLYLKKYQIINPDKFTIILECKYITNEDSLLDIILNQLNQMLENGKIASGILWNKSSYDACIIDKEVTILIDALDEISKEKQKQLIEYIKIYKQKYENHIIILTSRKEININFFNEMDLKELYLSDFDIDNDINKLYDIISRNNNKNNKNKSYFLDTIATIDANIIKNPLFISAVIIDYLVTGKIINKKMDIMESSFDLLFNDLEDNKMASKIFNIDLSKNEWTNLLCYIAYTSNYYDKIDLEKTINKFIEKYKLEDLKYKNVIDYLMIRGILSKSGFNHEYFKADLASKYFFNTYFDIEGKIFIINEDKLEEEIKNFLSINTTNWNQFVINIILYFDKELNNLMNKDMNFYLIFIEKMAKYFSSSKKEIIIELIKNEILYSNEFKDKLLEKFKN